MITYPKEGETFTIDRFRDNGGEIWPIYYLHVVNDKTGVCHRLNSAIDLEDANEMHQEYSAECAEGWHIEMTIGMYAGEVRARLK